jgi:uncharacterized protein YrrD
VFRATAQKRTGLMQRLGSFFNGFTIEATDGKVGQVTDFLFDDSTWTLRWLVVDTGGWLSGRKILLHPASLEKADIALRAFPVKLTKAQVEASPDIQSDEPVSRQMEANLYGYYGYGPVFMNGGYAGNGIALPISPPSYAGNAEGNLAPGERTHEPDPHLRSLSEVRSYNIHALDGQVGHLEDVLIDDEAWDIRYLVVDTKNWWIGKHVLLAPGSIKSIDWAEHFIRVDLTCYKIKGSPPWAQLGVVDHAYETVLKTYYGWATPNADPAQAKPIEVRGAA